MKPIREERNAEIRNAIRAFRDTGLSVEKSIDALLESKQYYLERETIRLIYFCANYGVVKKKTNKGE
jgi:hypothetical protein